MKKSVYSILFFVFIASGTFAGWVKEDIDTGFGKTSIVLDSSDKPHVAYGGVKYGYKDASGWHIEAVDIGSDPALALDSQEKPHISYKSGDYLKHAYYNGSNWIIETVEAGGSDSSIRINPNGYPYIGHYDDVNDRVKYAFKNASGWHCYGYYLLSYDVSTAIDADFDLHALFQEGNFELTYLFFDRSNWTSEHVYTYCY